MKLARLLKSNYFLSADLAQSVCLNISELINVASDQTVQKMSGLSSNVGGCFAVNEILVALFCHFWDTKLNLNRVFYRIFHFGWERLWGSSWRGGGGNHEKF